MSFAYTQRERDLQIEVREYLTGLMTPELERTFADGRFDPAVYRQVVERLGADGWLALGWPEEFGGQARSATEQYIFFNEARKASVPVPYLTINSVAPAIMRFGTPEQQRTYLPPIARGQSVFCIGYSEENAGTDLAALATKAELDGDEYVITGQKLYTSLAQIADHLWLAARTTPGGRHDGISIFIVPMDAPGVSITPIDTIGEYRTNTVYLDEVRVPAANVVGAVDRGWGVITNQLDFERVALSNPGYIEKQLREVHRWARTPGETFPAPIVKPRVGRGLADAFVKHEALKLLNWSMVGAIEAGQVRPADASVVKVYGTETSLDAYQVLMDVLDEDGYAQSLHPGSPIKSDLERAYRRELTFTFGGGANEIQRQIIARQALGLGKDR